MNVHMLKSKLHQACVTDADVHYEGSLGIDVELMEAVGLHPYEKVLVANLTNGSRLETYAIAEAFGSRRIVLNGPAAHLGSAGDRVIIMAFCEVDEADVRRGNHRPRVMRLDEYNEPVQRIPASPLLEEAASMLGS